MAFRVEISRKAFDDLDAIADSIKGSGDFESAERWFNGILGAIHALRKMPERCPVSEESRDIGREIRVLLHGSRNRAYKVYYGLQKETQTLQVFHISHWARKPVSPDDLERLLTDTDPIED